MQHSENLSVYIFRLLAFYFMGWMISQLLMSLWMYIQFPSDNNLSILQLAVKNPKIWYWLRGFQLIHSILCFLIPSLLVWKSYNGNYDFSYPREERSSYWVYILVPLLLITFMPFVQNLYSINMQMHFFEPLHTAMLEMENQMNDMLEHMLADRSVGAIAMNFFIIAISAAIFEELFFRGVMQRILMGYMNPHVAILFTAFVFSAIHMQFFGFLPRMALGILLGYLFWRSKRLSVSIWAHSIFNGFQLIVYYISDNQKQGVKEGELSEIPIYAVIMSVLLFLILYYFFHNFFTKNETIQNGNK